MEFNTDQKQRWYSLEIEALAAISGAEVLKGNLVKTHKQTKKHWNLATSCP